MASHDIIMAAAGGAPEDDYFKNVSLLLTGDGTNGAQNNTFLDSSTNNFTITRNGNTTQGTFSPYGNLWSNYFDGNGDYLTFPSNTVFEIGASDNFTIECWVNFYGSGSDKGGFFQSTTDISSAVGPIWFGYLGGSLYCSRHGSGAYAVSYSWAPSLGTWYHVAATRSSGTTRLFIDGVLVQTSTLQNNIAFTQNGAAVGVVTTPSYFNGFLSNVRFIKGTALYTSNFTPSTTPLTAITNTQLLTCQSNRFIDNSSNNFAITVNGDTKVTRFSPFNPTAPYSASTIGGSGYFDGTGDYLSVPANSAFSFGTGDFTVEAWVFLDVVNNNGSLILNQSYSGANGDWIIRVGAAGSATGKWEFTTWYGGTAYQALSNSSAVSGIWTHIAGVRNGNVFTLYVNGVAQTTTATNTNSVGFSNQTTLICGDNTSGVLLKGSVSNLRVVKGTAVYTGNFTPPTAPLTAITNTSLLCNFTNAGIPDAAMMNDLETVGNAQVSTSVKKYGTGSLAFDGTGDYLTAPKNSAYSFGTGDFTIEAWIYVSAAPTSGNGFRVYSYQYPVSSSSVAYIGITNSGGTVYANAYLRSSNNTGGTAYTGTTGIPLNTWTHIALTRSGTTGRLFTNGVIESTQTSQSQDITISAPVYIATYDGSIEYFNGYIDDLRVTKGYARYTANFTPPTAALPTY